MHEIWLKGKEWFEFEFRGGDGEWVSDGVGSKAVEKCRSGEQRRIVISRVEV